MTAKQRDFNAERIEEWKRKQEEQRKKDNAKIIDTWRLRKDKDEKK